MRAVPIRGAQRRPGPATVLLPPRSLDRQPGESRDQLEQGAPPREKPEHGRPALRWPAASATRRIIGRSDQLICSPSTRQRNPALHSCAPPRTWATVVQPVVSSRLINPRSGIRGGQHLQIRVPTPAAADHLIARSQAAGRCLKHEFAPAKLWPSKPHRALPRWLKAWTSAFSPFAAGAAECVRAGGDARNDTAGADAVSPPRNSEPGIRAPACATGGPGPGHRRQRREQQGAGDSADCSRPCDAWERIPVPANKRPPPAPARIRGINQGQGASSKQGRAKFSVLEELPEPRARTATVP